MSREQVCPACGLTEAAGAYCTRCLARTGPAYARDTVRSEAQRAIRHSMPQRAATAAETSPLRVSGVSPLAGGPPLLRQTSGGG